MIYILSCTTKKPPKTLSGLLHSKLKKIQRLFTDLHRNVRTFQGKMEIKDVSRTSPEIQGLFKTVPTLFFWIHLSEIVSWVSESFRQNIGQQILNLKIKKTNKQNLFLKNLTDFRKTVEAGVDPRLHLLTRVP